MFRARRNNRASTGKVATFRLLGVDSQAHKTSLRSSAALPSVAFLNPKGALLYQKWYARSCIRRFAPNGAKIPVQEKNNKRRDRSRLLLWASVDIGCLSFADTDGRFSVYPVYYFSIRFVIFTAKPLVISCILWYNVHKYDKIALLINPKYMHNYAK